MSNFHLEASNIFKDNCLILMTFMSLAWGEELSHLSGKN